MAESAYYREIRAFLRENYGIRDIAEAAAGTGHKRWSFEYGGKPRTLTLHNANGKAKAETNILAIKKQDIRRVLGEPLPKAEASSPKRHLDDMLPAAPFNPALPIEPVLPPPSAADKILAGLQDAVAYTKGDESAAARVTIAEEPADITEPPPPLPEPTGRTDRAYLKYLVDEVNRVAAETEYRWSRNKETGRWRLFTMIS